MERSGKKLVEVAEVSPGQYTHDNQLMLSNLVLERPNFLMIFS